MLIPFIASFQLRLVSLRIVNLDCPRLDTAVRRDAGEVRRRPVEDDEAHLAFLVRLDEACEEFAADRAIMVV